LSGSTTMSCAASASAAAECRLARVATDYHVEFKDFFYSVPHGLMRQQVDICATSRAIDARLGWCQSGAKLSLPSIGMRSPKSSACEEIPQRA
jgi:hypothetical protein